MLAGSKKAILYLIMAFALWGGIAPRLAPCMPQEAMACCAHEAERCAMDEDCCQCGSAPAHDLTIPAIAKAPKPAELPVVFPSQSLLVSQKQQQIANAGTRLSGDDLKPPKLYLLKRSLLI